MSPISSQTHALSINPTTGEQIGHYAYESAEALDAALTRAASGFSRWKRTPLQARAAANHPTLCPSTHSAGPCHEPDFQPDPRPFN